MLKRAGRASFFSALAGDLPTIVRGDGLYLYDESGRRMIDAAGGVGALSRIELSL